MERKLQGVGVFLIGVAFCIWAIAYGERAQREPPIHPEYQLVQLGNGARDQFLYDKNNGRTWRVVCSGQMKDFNCQGMIVWQEEYIEGITPDSANSAKIYKFMQEMEAEKIKKAAESARQNVLQK